ncbi:MAG: helicase C-terminal domain-containing protein [Candidatus Bathyarchaeia archaeon]
MSSLPGKAADYFPYSSVRPFQDVFTNTIYEAVKAGNHVLLEGSNGLGKTVAALSACLPIAKEQGLQILYTAKTHRQHDRVIEELRAISKRQEVSGLSIRGRSQMCFHPFIARHAPDARSAMEICELLKAREQCPYHENLHKNFDRYAELQSHILSRPYTASEIQEICRVEGFCPYETIKLMVGEVDVVALSYLYVFDPVIRGAFLKQLERFLRETILVVDEAHNLPDTALGIASDSLSLFAVRQAEREAKKHNYQEIATFSRRFKALIEKMAARVEEEAHVPPDFLIETLRTKIGINAPLTFFETLHTKGSAVKRKLLAQGKYPRSYIHKLGEFLLKWLETSDDVSFTHVLSRYVTKTGVPSARLEIVALDPSKITAPVFSSVYCSLGMSGTLEPLESYAKITHLPEATIQRAVPSPFPREHILPLACCGVTTAMKQRTKSMYRKLAKRIAEVVRYTPANVGVFTASYEVLEGLLEAGLEEVVNKPLFSEYRAMSSKENERLVNRFKSYADRGGAVLLGVQGGRSSEGVDYPGNTMNSVAVVGVPYAEPTPRSSAQIKYYESRFPGHGREYGYVLPALKKASQAAGRPIRTLEDRGAIIFLDYRFATRYCRRFLPLWIRRGLKTLPDEDGSIAQELILFFGFPED